jgi:hexokinase
VSSKKQIWLAAPGPAELLPHATRGGPRLSFVQETIGVLKNRNVAVVDAGGTNLRTALAKLDSEDGCMLPEQWVEEDMPGKHAEATREQFYNTLVARLKPMANEFKVIGFCFSFPTDITKDQGGNIDGRLIKFTKDINITGMEGSKVGAELLKALEKAEIKDKKVVVLNDTVASLLAGVDKIKDAYAYVGFILGTGTNTAYVEKNGNIAKIEKNIGSQVINVESGGFTEFERSVFDKKLDKDGVNIFEKAISGDYLGPLALLVMKGLASEEKVFTKAGAQKLLSMDNLKTKPISYIMCKGKTRKEDIEELTSFSDEDRKVIEELTSESFSDEDRKVMKQVFEAVVDRAALLAAVNIAAAVLKSGASKEDTRPVCITIDGTAYYKTHRLKEKTEHYLHGLLGEKHKIKYECIQIDRAPIIGAAIAGLTTYCQ